MKQPEKLNLWFVLMIVGLLMAVAGGFFFGEQIINAPKWLPIIVGTALIAVLITLGALGVRHNKKER